MRPIEEGCQCPACRRYSRAYIRHLLKAKEMLGMRLCVLHNLYFYNTMMEEIRDALDAGSLVGVKMAEKPADKDHPVGHGRIEYIAALIVAFLVLDVGFGFFKDSFAKVLHPGGTDFPCTFRCDPDPFHRNKILDEPVQLFLSGKNNSKIMMATAADAMGDMITTSVTILSILIFHFFHLNVDGFIGIIVAAIVMWAGVGIARDTLSPLIGAPGDPETCQAITDLVESYDGIMGTHDLIVHNYGPGRSIASIHAEVSQDADIRASHEIIDKAEREVSRKLNILLVIHMDLSKHMTNVSFLSVLRLQKQYIPSIRNFLSTIFV